MKTEKLNVDLNKLYARYAASHNASEVGREFGLSRYQVTQRWNNLPPEERERYETEVRQARMAAVIEVSTKTRENMGDALEKIARLKDDLLNKLINLINIEDEIYPLTITKIKDAATALKTIAEIDAASQNDDADSFFKSIVMKQRYERPN